MALREEVIEEEEEGLVVIEEEEEGEVVLVGLVGLVRLLVEWCVVGVCRLEGEVRRREGWRREEGEGTSLRSRYWCPLPLLNLKRTK